MLIVLSIATENISGAEPAPESLPLIRQITHGPKFHWFGYYDKLEFDPSNRYVLANEVDFEGRSPTADDAIKVGMVDLQDHDKWIELGQSHAWSWQQGCMLQWIPGSKSEVIWNDREGDAKTGKFVSRIMDVHSKKLRTIPMPIYALSPDGKKAITTDFRRIQNHRPGYGYAGLPDPAKDLLIPATSGVWTVDILTGESKLIISIADATNIRYENGKPDEFQNASHWFNHLLFNTDGTRILFLHRWRDKDAKNGSFVTRMFTANADGSDLFTLDPHGQTSHFIWKDPKTVTAWAWNPADGLRFYDFTDHTRDVQVVGKGVMNVNGHNTYIANTNNEWILNDTYPDNKRLQNPYLYHSPTRVRVPLGHFSSPKNYTGEYRCDTHPRSSPDGNWVVIDSPHNEGRQMYLIDISRIPHGK